MIGIPGADMAAENPLSVAGQIAQRTALLIVQKFGLGSPNHGAARETMSLIEDHAEGRTDNVPIACFHK